MNTDDYVFTYFAILDKTASMLPTYDKVVEMDIIKHNEKFAATIKKYDQEIVDKTMRQIFVQLINERVFQGTIAQDEIIISNTTPLAVEILQHVQDPLFWAAMKATANQWEKRPLTSFVIDYVEENN